MSEELNYEDIVTNNGTKLCKSLVKNKNFRNMYKTRH